MWAMPHLDHAADASELRASSLTRQHHRNLGLVLGGLALVVVLGSWSLYHRHKTALTWTLSTQGEQLQLALNTTLDTARLHTLGMRLSVERNLRQPLFNDGSLAERLERRNLAPLRDAPWDRMPQDLAKDMGAVHIHPATNSDYRRELNAPLSALGQAVAAHQQQQKLAWSYFYDAQKRWRWVYPAQARDEVLVATGQTDMGPALTTLWEAGGTRPIDAAGPARNPARDVVWTAPHTDPFKKTQVISALAPVYSGDNYIGLMGSDLTLDALTTVMQQHPLTLGQAWVVDHEGRVLASSGSTSDALPPATGSANGGWLRYALRGSPFSLVVAAPPGTVASRVLWQLLPELVIGLLGLLATAGTAIWLYRQFTLPALQLADYVQNADGPHIKRPPKAPAHWKPWFDRAAHAARDRRDQFMHHHQRANQLETEVKRQAAALRQSEGRASP